MISIWVPWICSLCSLGHLRFQIRAFIMHNFLIIDLCSCYFLLFIFGIVLIFWLGINPSPFILNFSDFFLGHCGSGLLVCLDQKDLTNNLIRVYSFGKKRHVVL